MRPFFQEETVVQATGAVGEVRASGYILALVLLAVCTWTARSLSLHTLIHRAGVAIPSPSRLEALRKLGHSHCLRRFRCSTGFRATAIQDGQASVCDRMQNCDS